MTKPATTKQFQLIKRLIDERQLSQRDVDYVEQCRQQAIVGQLATTGASNLIDHLMALPKQDNPSEQDEPEAGIYQSTDGMFRVYLGQKSGRMLAKEITMALDNSPVYTYRGSATRVLPEDAQRLSLEEVGQIGQMFDHCLCCGARLDDPESVDRGIGPICASKY